MKKQENMRLEELTTHKKNKRLLKREKFMKKCIDELNQELTDHPTSYKLNSCHAKLENNSKHIKRQFAVTHSLLALATLTTIVGDRKSVV